MLFPVQGSLLPSCPSLIFSQSYLQARSLCQVPLGAPVHLQPQLRLFLHCPFVPPALMQPQINPFFSLISLLPPLAPSLFQHPHWYHYQLLSPFLVQSQLSAFPSKPASSSFFLPCWVRALSQSCLVSVPFHPPALLIPPGIFLHPLLPPSGSTSLPFTLEPAGILALSSLLLCQN